MPTTAPTTQVTVTESGNGPYGQIVTAGHHVQAADEPERVGGHDTGLSPFEFVMAGLGACTAMTIRMYAERHGWPLKRVSVQLSHKRVTSGDGLRDHFRRVVHLSGNLDPQQRTRLLEIAERCPVSQTLQRGAEIETLPDEAYAPAGE